MPRLPVTRLGSRAAMAQPAQAAEAPAAGDYLRTRGVRLVKPYFFDFKCSVKSRWTGKSMLEVFQLEFPARDRDYWEQAFADGRLREAHGRVGLHDPLKGGMQLQHYIHRHEPPVLDTAIPILGETEDVVAVGKPASMPVHVSGQYRKNSLLSILQAERPHLGPLHPVHRLDKAVSGVLLFARSPAAAERVRRLIEGAEVEKVYVARVLGAFPEGRTAARAGLAWDPQYNNVTAVPEGAAADAGGRAAKASHTDFERIAVAADGRTSLVRCWPRTGRTHQIRVHLQWLGHPIANDVQYGGSFSGPAPPFLTPGTAAAKRYQEALQAGFAAVPQPKRARLQAGQEAGPQQDGGAAAADGAGPGQPPAGQDHDRAGSAQDAGGAAAAGGAGEGEEFGWLDGLRVAAEQDDAVCLNCPRWVPLGYPVDLRPLWLAAVRYRSAEWDFACPPPPWAAADFVPP